MMKRFPVQFPNDENGDVLRRMAASGFAFGQPHDVDFFAIFPRKDDAMRVAKLLAAADRTDNSLTAIADSHQSGQTELKIVRNMLVTHENVTAFEAFLGELCAGHGGALDGWGVLQDPEGEMAAPGGFQPATQAGRTNSRLDDPDDQLDQAERNFVDGIRQHGWMQTNALDEDDKPGFAFTTGFAVSIGHPELIIFKIDKKVANDVFWVLYRCAQNGKPVPRACRTRGVFPTDDAYVFPVARRHYANYLGWSRWFYRGDDFECLQVVWPDEAGVFPWEAGFDIKYAGHQIDLTEHGWAAEVAGA